MLKLQDPGFGTRRYSDDAYEKGSKARRHIGVIAQDIKTAFEAHGVDPFEYGILCYDNTPATEAVYDILEDGTQVMLQEARDAHSGYTVRYEEILCLEAAYMRREMLRLRSLMIGGCNS